MKKNTTKRAFLFSILALVLCMSMFVGTTYAWFTDSVSSAGNKIVAGNLKVDLELLGENGFESIKDSKAPIFTYDNWEPGYVDAKVLKIENEGTLELKWKAVFNSAEELGILADVIDVYVLASATELAAPADRDLENYTKVGTVRDFVNTIESTTYGTLAAKEVAYLGIALKMQETAGNEYKLQSLGEFDITIVATQMTAEFDSFDDQYDADATYPIATAAGLKAALAEGGTYVLAADISVNANDTLVVADGVNVEIDLNGHSIDGISNAINANRKIFTVKGEMTVKGNGMVTMAHTGANMAWGNLTAPFSVEGGSLTLEEGVTVLNLGGTDMAYAVDVNTTLGESSLDINGAILHSTYIGVRIFNNHKTAKGTVNFNAGDIQGAKNGYDIWAQLMSCPAENAIVNIADSFNYTTEAMSGTMYYIESDAVSVYTVSQLDYALANAKDGDVIRFMKDMKGTATATQIENVDVVIDGNGYKFDGSIRISGGSRPTAETLTIENVNFVADKASDYASIDAYWGDTGKTRYAHNLTIENCTFTMTGAAKYAVVAIDLYQPYNVLVKDCKVTGAHSALQNKGGHDGITVDGLEATDCKSGVSFGTASKAVIKNSTIQSVVAYGYGVRVDASDAYELTVENCTITAAAPVLARKATGAAKVTVTDNCTLTTTADYQVIFTASDYDEGKALTAPTGTYTFNGSNALVVYNG